MTFDTDAWGPDPAPPTDAERSYVPKKREKKTETFDNATDFLAALHGKKPRTAARDARPGLPRAARSARTGLSTFIKAGWCWTYQTGKGYKLERGALSSGWQPDEATCCKVAKELKR